MSELISNLIHDLKYLKVSTGISDRDQMFNSAAGLPRYLDVGRSALRLVTTALIARLGYPGGDAPLKSILDFGSAFGRVTRFLRAGFPDAEIAVADLNSAAVRWCVDNLGVTALGDTIPSNRFDLIILGSVLTHLPEAQTAALLQQLKAALLQNGVLLFTTQGRFAYQDILRNPERKSYGLTGDQTKQIISGFCSSGYGFCEYIVGRGYGLSLISKSWIDRQFHENSDLVQILFQEKGYDHHQDAYAYLKASIASGGRSGL